MIKEKIISYNYKVSKSQTSLANYKKYIISNNQIFISGQLPLLNNTLIFKGKIDKETNHDIIKKSIEQSTINLLCVLDEAIEQNSINFKNISVLNIKGYLNTSNDFENHSTLFNFSSDLIIKILGFSQGVHSRSVIGVNSLPMGSPVEIEGTFLIK